MRTSAVSVLACALLGALPVLTLAEVVALGHADAYVTKERAAIFVDAILDPAAALAQFDGGKLARRETLNYARSARVEVSGG